MNKIAFCFRTYDNLNQLAAWERFFAEADPNLYIIKVHALNPEQVTQKLLLDHMDPYPYGRPDYARIETIRVTLKMFEHAFQVPHVYKTINITNSCIPLWSFSKIYEALMKNDKGYMHFNEAIKVVEDPVYLRRYNQLHDKRFVAREQWIFNKPFGLVFTKTLSDFFRAHDHLHLFSNILGAEEHYFSNTLLHHHQMHLVENRPITRNYAIPVGVSEFNFDAILHHKLMGYLFYRKVSPHAHLDLDALYVQTTRHMAQRTQLKNLLGTD